MVNILINIATIILISNFLGFAIAWGLISINVLPREWLYEIEPIKNSVIWSVSGEETPSGIKYRTSSAQIMTRSAAVIITCASPHHVPQGNNVPGIVQAKSINSIFPASV